MTKRTHGVGFLEYFSRLDDPRRSGKVLYPLDEVMLLMPCGELAGADGFVEIAGWGDINLGVLRRFLPFTGDIAWLTERHHWGIENRLHRVLDVIFHDDLRRLRTGFSPPLRSPLRRAKEGRRRQVGGRVGERAGALRRTSKS